ncbi:MAG TPA: nucleotide exchange factor GrpE [Streptosporangiaceae bacterium]|nr:nucleotide exchange factor GrpE [Streptosporangiaceae bacterium]
MKPERSEEHQGPVIRDKRRIDPETGEVRVPPTETTAAAPPSESESGSDRAGGGKEDDGEMAKLKAKLDERTNDLQRLQAEFANYRKRVERDRVAVREQALANVLVELLPVLDDIGRARDHDELTGGFKSVGEALEAKVAKLGLERYGEKGEPFDPTVHEALLHSYSPEVTEPTCVEILQPGYRVGGRVLRAARVAVAEPEEPPAHDGGEPVRDASADGSAGGAASVQDAASADRSDGADGADGADGSERSGGSGGSGESAGSSASGGSGEENDERD